MTLRNRVFLLVSGAIIFLFLAPAAVFFARGFRYDFAEKKIVKTGSLSIKTDPGGAQVFLNHDELGQKTPLVKRFLLPGEYLVKTTKADYFPWEKRVAVYGQQVTFLPPGGPTKIPLFLKTPISSDISSSTKDFYLKETKVRYLSQNQKIWEFDLREAPPKSVLITTEEFINSASGADIDAAAKQSYGIDPISKMFFVETKDGEKKFLLSTPLPDYSSSKTIVSPDKLVFILLDQDLYQVKERLEKINSNVSYAAWDNLLPGLVYGNFHEIWLYQTDKQENILISRNSKTLGEAKYAGKIGYVFVKEENDIKAIEVDSFGQPNIYTLYTAKNPQTKFAVNSDGTIIVIQEQENLFLLRIR